MEKHSFPARSLFTFWKRAPIIKVYNVHDEGDGGAGLLSEPGHGASPAEKGAEQITPE